MNIQIFVEIKKLQKNLEVHKTNAVARSRYGASERDSFGILERYALKHVAPPVYLLWVKSCKQSIKRTRGKINPHLDIGSDNFWFDSRCVKRENQVDDKHR